MKNKLRLLVCVFFLLSKTLNAQTTCISGPGVSGTGITTVNGITIVPTLSGNTAVNPINITMCGISITGSRAWLVPYLIGSSNTGSITYTFSQPVNNVVVRFAGGGNSFYPEEVVTFATNNGTVTTLPIFLCSYSQSGNSYTGTVPNGEDSYGVVKVISTIPYTSLTVTNTGNIKNYGTEVDLCISSIIAQCQAGSLSPVVN